MQAELCDELWAGYRHVPQWVSDIIRARFIGGKRQSAGKKPTTDKLDHTEFYIIYLSSDCNVHHSQL
jgi:hypothetical protein